MSDDRFAQVERLYHEAMARPPAERAAFLDEACGGDDALRQDVESLLAFQTGADEFLARPAIEEAARSGQRALEADPWPTIPGYTLIRVLGEGGMGVVYLAWQETPFRRLVALKLIKPGMDTRQVVARFETERQALALMDHPNIAAVFDAGSTAQGRPYFVMEFVEGVSITDYCDRGRLSTSDRLALFVQVCAAVQHAHQKGVIHRDLKPSNVIVAERDGHAVPKVIDFGTAKAMGGVWNATATQVGEGMVIGTLEYMSPEQAALSTDIDTATDVYSLGVLLYELLVGRLPFDTAELRLAGHDEMRRVIRESEPPKPSSRVDRRTDKSGAAARARQTDAPGLTRQLRGDLDWITLKALEKDRKRRYATVAAFATDIGRFLGHQPVDARPPSSAYRIRKFTRRHRGAVAGAVLLFVVLLTGLATSRWQYLRAENARIEMTRQSTEAESERARAELARAIAEGATAEANIQRLEAERQRVLATQETQRAVSALDLADYRNYVITIGAADAEIQASRLSQARERLTLVPAARRGWEWDHLFLRAEPNPILVDPAPCPSTASVTNTLGMDPDGKRIYFRYCGRVNSWNTETFDHSVVPVRTSDFAAAPPSARRVEGFLNLGPDLRPPVEKKWKLYVTDSIGVRLLSKLVGPFDRKPLCADLSADGRMLALGFDPINSITRLESGDFKQVIEPYVFEVWDMENGRQILRVIPPMPPSADPRAAQPSTPLDAGMKCFVRLSPDTTLLATSTLVVQVWDAATGARVHVDSVQAGRRPQAIAFSPTTRQLAIGRRNGLIDVLNFANSNRTVTSLDGADVVRPRPLKDDDRLSDATNRMDEEVRAVEFASDGRTVVSAQAKRVIVWDLQSTRARKLLDVPQSQVTGLVVHEQTVYSSHADGTVTVEALEGSTGITRLKGSTRLLGDTARAAISSDSRTIALGSEGKLVIWHPDERRETVVRPAPVDARGQRFSMIVPLADNRTILTSLGTLGSLMRWDGETRQSVSLQTTDRMEPDCAAIVATGRGTTSVVRLSVAVSPNDRYLALALGHCVVVRDLSTAGTIAVRRVDRPAEMLPLNGGPNRPPYMDFRFLSNEWILVTASQEQLSGQPVINSVMRWNWTTDRVSARRVFSTPTRPALPLAASKDGRRVALAEAGFVTIWDGTLAHEIGRISIQNLNGNLRMALSADGTRLALAASGQSAIVIWDTATSQPLLTLADDDAPQFLAFTPSGQLIAANSSGGLTIWETQRPKCAECPKFPVPVK